MLNKSRNLTILLLFLSLNTAFAGELKRFKPFKDLAYTSLQKLQVRSPLIAIIDTGIDYENLNLQKNLVSGSLSKSGTLKAVYNSNSKSYGLDFTSGTLGFTPDDDHGHGTHIAGIINEINPKARLIPIKYYNPMSSDEENLNSTIQAIKAAIELGVDIINYSSGGEGFSQREYDALKLAKDKGITVVTAAGNFGKNIDNKATSYYPASYNLNNIISVLNIDTKGSIHETSNWGVKNADVATYGTDIMSYLPNKRLGSLSGTSQSTAIITAYASILIGMNSSRTSYITIKNTILKSITKSTSLLNRCKTGGYFNPSKFSQITKIKSRKVAGN